MGALCKLWQKKFMHKWLSEIGTLLAQSKTVLIMRLVRGFRLMRLDYQTLLSLASKTHLALYKPQRITLSAWVRRLAQGTIQKFV